MHLCCALPSKSWPAHSWLKIHDALNLRLRKHQGYPLSEDDGFFGSSHRSSYAQNLKTRKSSPGFQVYWFPGFYLQIGNGWDHLAANHLDGCDIVDVGHTENEVLDANAGEFLAQSDNVGC